MALEVQPMEKITRGRRRDPGMRVKAEQRKRYKGIHLYIPAQWLQAADLPGDGSAVYYRIWPGRGGSLLVRLYREP
jgi:hypothetical protein